MKTILETPRLHHFTPTQKIALYQEICKALKPGGRYVEGDYMVETQAQEDAFATQKAAYQAAQGISEGELYHFDTPCTIENQKSMLLKAGFANIHMVWRSGNTAILTAEKAT